MKDSYEGSETIQVEIHEGYRIKDKYINPTARKFFEMLPGLIDFDIYLHLEDIGEATNYADLVSRLSDLTDLRETVVEESLRRLEEGGIISFKNPGLTNKNHRDKYLHV